MSLLLTCHVDHYRIDVVHRLRRGFGPNRLHAGRGEPFTDQLAMQPIMLHDQHTLHGWLPR